MKYLAVIALLTLVGCSNEPKESDKLLTDYKNKQLDKAKQVEAEMNKRVDDLNRQLDAIEKKEEDEQH